LFNSVRQLQRSGIKNQLIEQLATDCFLWQGICPTKTKDIHPARYASRVCMRKTDLGEFEEVVLLAVVGLSPGAYSVAIAQELEQETGQRVTSGAVYTALDRLESKGLLLSKMGEATRERGGRRKRLYTITPAGSAALQQVRKVRNRLWDKITLKGLPPIDVSFS
jgi:DNA-binding PadR family transcriptional regulator